MLLLMLLLALLVVGMLAGGTLTALLFDRRRGLGPHLAAFHARQELGEIERRTIQRLLAVELGVRRARAASPPSTDVVDGTAADVEPSP